VPLILIVSNGHWSSEIGVQATLTALREVGAFENLNACSWNPVFPEAPGAAGLF